MTLGHYKRHATSHALITPKKKTKRKNYVPVFSQSSVLSSKRGSSKGKLLSEGDCVC